MIGQGILLICKGILKYLVQKIIDVLRHSKGFGKECSWFSMGLERNSIDFQNNSKGFGTEFNWFPDNLVGFALISKGCGKELN